MGSTMPPYSRSIEELPRFVDYSSNSPSLLSLPLRASPSRTEAWAKSPQLSEPEQSYSATFLSPLYSDRCASESKANHARDEFPFPLQPANIQLSNFATNSDNIRSRSGKRKWVSEASPYLTPPASPDRYIPLRRSPESSAKSFRLSKPPHLLSSSERLVRDNSVSHDPFSPRSLRWTEDVNRRDTLLRPRDTQPLQTASVRAGGTLRSRLDAVDLQHRRVSAGAVWNVGGTTSALGPINGVSNGRGGLFRSGTNAPMYTSRFCDPETTDQSNERFEGRVAAALDIDQTSRMLQISQSPKRGRSASIDRRGNKRKASSQTVWKNGQWITEVDGLCKPVTEDTLHHSLR